MTPDQVAELKDRVLRQRAQQLQRENRALVARVAALEDEVAERQAMHESTLERKRVCQEELWELRWRESTLRLQIEAMGEEPLA